MSVRIANNTIAGQGDDFGLAFYALFLKSDSLDNSSAMSPEIMLNFAGATSLAEIQALFPDEIFETDPAGMAIEDLFGPDVSSAQGFSGITVSFNGMDGDTALIEDNNILDFKNGIFAAVVGSENIGITADENISSHNIVVGDNTKYTLSGSNAGSFSHLW